MKKIHLGSFTNIIPGWINVDMLVHPGIFYHDLRNPLPFEDNSIDFFFSEHFLEHLTLEEGTRMLTEVYRCLKPGGVSRTTVPSLDTLVKCYVDNNLEYYKPAGWVPKDSCELLNGGMRYWEHKYMYNNSKLINLHLEIGFKESYVELYKKSKFTELQNLEHRPSTGKCHIEAIK